MKKIYIIIILILTLSIEGFSQSSANELAIMDLSSSGLSYAEGNTGVASSTDLRAVNLNPAALSDLEYLQFHLQYTNAYDNLYSYASLLGCYPLGKLGTIGFGTSMLYLGGIERMSTTTIGEQGEFQEIQNLLTAAYGIKILKDLSVGGDIKSIFHKIDDYTSVYFSFDISAHYRLNDFVSFGLIFKNPYISNIKKINGVRNPITPSIRTGITVYPLTDSVGINLDLETDYSNDYYLIGFGSQIKLFDWISLVIGYEDIYQSNFSKSTNSFGKINAGLSVSFDTISVVASGQSHSMGTSYNSGVTYIHKPIIINNPTPKYIHKEKIKNLNKKERHMLKAIQSYNKGEFKKAEELFTKILQKDPNNPIARDFFIKSRQKASGTFLNPKQKKELNEHIKKGNDYVNIQKPAKALEEFRAALDMDPNNEEAKAKINEIRKKIAPKLEQLMNEAIEYYINGDFEAANKKIEEIKRIDPLYKPALSLEDKIVTAINKEKYEGKDKEEREKTVKKLTNQGLELYFNEEYELAIKKFERVLKFDPSNTEANLYLDKARKNLAEKEDINERIEKSNKSLEYGKKLCEKGIYDKGLEAIRDAINYDKNNLEAKKALEKYSDEIKKLQNEKLKKAKEYISIGNYTKAVEILNEIKELSPESSQATQAEELITKITVKNKRQTDRYIEIAEKAKESGDYPLSLENYNAALKLDPKNKKASKGRKEVKNILEEYIQSLLDQGVDYLNKKNYKKAMERFSEVLDIDSLNDNAKKYLKDAERLLTEERLSKSKEDFINQGDAYFENRQFKLAKDEYEQVLRIDKNNEMIISKIEQCNKEIKETERKELFDKHYQSGVSAFEETKYDDAITSWKSARKLVNINKGEDINIIDDKIEEAKKQNEILQNDIIKQANEAFNNNDLSLARDLYLQALEKNPKSIHLREKIGNIDTQIHKIVQNSLSTAENAFQKGDYEKAAKEYLKISKLEKDSPVGSEAYRNYEIANEANISYQNGMSSYKNGVYFQAVENFNKVIAINRNDKNTKTYLKDAKNKLIAQVQDLRIDAKKYYQKKDYKRAIQCYNIILEANPDDVEARFFKMKSERKFNEYIDKLYTDGLLAFNTRDYKTALDNFGKVAVLNINYKEVQKYRKDANAKYEIEAKKAAERERELAKAKIAYANSMKSKSSNNTTPNMVTTTSKNKNLTHKKNTSYSSTTSKPTTTKKPITTKKPKAGSSAKVQKLFYSGLALYRQNKLKQAISVWRKCLSLNPSFSKARQYINKARYKMKK